MRLLTMAVLSTLSLATSGAAETVVPVAKFRSVELQNGGHVIVRHGATQRVTILRGDPRAAKVRLTDGQRLVIDTGHGHERFQIEVITPELSAVAVSNGGTLQTVGAFPAQAAIEADVEQGGTIDIRSIAADAIDASVHSGGRIFINPRQSLTAAVVSGGVITYWGNARVQQSVRGGGVVERGARENADRPLSELSPNLPAIPPLPPVPATRK